MGFSKLNQYSIEFSQLLFSVFPEWEAEAEILYDRDGNSFLKLEIPAPPSSEVENGLIISTEDEAIFLAFDFWEGSFYENVGDDCGNRGILLGREYVVCLISEIVNESISVVSWWKNNEQVAFSTIKSGISLMTDELIGNYDYVRIRSWNGAKNEDKRT